MYNVHKLALPFNGKIFNWIIRNPLPVYQKTDNEQKKNPNN